MYTQSPERLDRMSPADALELLKQGNRRFTSNARLNRNLLEQVEETKGGQWPFAVVLGCIDSRAPAELIFDQGVGDIFNVRIAGNFLNEDILGSMEFACKVAGAKLVVVLGHSQCGAIKGACDGVELGHLTGVLAKLQPALDAVKEPLDATERSSSNEKFVESVSRANVRIAAESIPSRSEVLRELHDAGSIDIVPAVYDLGSGAVQFHPGAAG